MYSGDAYGVRLLKKGNQGLKIIHFGWFYSQNVNIWVQILFKRPNMKYKTQWTDRERHKVQYLLA